MNCRTVIADAWQFTKSHKKLMWWYAFVPSILNTLIGILYMTYQFFAFKRSALFDDAEESFLTTVISNIYVFLQNNSGIFFPALIAAIVILLLYVLLPTICQGALIQLTSRYRRGEMPKIATGLSLGLLSFLPLFEYHLLVKSFSLFSLLSEAGFVARNLPETIKLLLPLFLLFIVIGFILTLLFTYSEFFIILKKKSVLTSMVSSAKLVIMSWQHTFLIGILMAIIGVRVIINVVAVMLIPALLFFSAGFIATLTLSIIGIAIGILISGIALFFASYVNGILQVFANTVWTFTFLELMDKKEIEETISQ